MAAVMVGLWQILPDSEKVPDEKSGAHQAPGCVD